MKIGVTITIEIKTSNGGKKNEFLPAEMAQIILCEIDMQETHAFIEKVGAMKGQGVTSMFSFGKGFGIWIGILAAFRVPYTFVTPQAWKKMIMAGKHDKDAYRIRAQELYPGYAAQLNRKKDNGRADALLIAHYGFSHFK